jgi:glycosyltransferase involved in cell wall biosynthesis
MKILIVNASDIQGGAARAAYRLHESLLKEGEDSKMLVQNKNSGDWTVLGPNSKIQKGVNKLRPTLDSIPIKIYKNRVNTLFSTSWLGFSHIVDKINDINPDIVHLHWICGGMIRIEDIARIKKPVIWSLHDNWAFTGGCHIMGGCKKYKNKCGSCPALGSKKDKDLSRKIYSRKKKVFNQKKDITIVGLSKWIYDCSKSSSLLKNKRHVNLPNSINTKVFKPFSRIKSRELWNLPIDKKMILFGAMNATTDTNKGFKILVETLVNLDINNNIEFIVFGGREPKQPLGLNFKVNYVGSLTDDVSLSTLYNVADVMVVPSFQENLSNTIMESMACGTPVVAFNVGGNSDMIEHKVNGYLAIPFDTKDLKRGIEYIIHNPNIKKIRNNSRQKILSKFDSVFVANKYIELYKNTTKQV